MVFFLLCLCRILQGPLDFRKTGGTNSGGTNVFQSAFNWESRYGVPMFSRNSIQSVDCMVMNTATTQGSNWVPEQR
jgi:hypothetical protein